LQSAEDAARVASTPAARRHLHIDTSGVTFERATGRRRPVHCEIFFHEWQAAMGWGHSTKSEQGQLRLIRDVHIQMQPAAEPAAKKEAALPAQVEMTAAAWRLTRSDITVELSGPATAVAPARGDGWEITLLMDGSPGAYAIASARLA